MSAFLPIYVPRKYNRDTPCGDLICIKGYCTLLSDSSPQTYYIIFQAHLPRVSTPKLLQMDIYRVILFAFANYDQISRILVVESELRINSIKFDKYR